MLASQNNKKHRVSELFLPRILSTTLSSLSFHNSDWSSWVLLLVVTMVCAAQSMISASTCAFPSHKLLRKLQRDKLSGAIFRIRASSSSTSEEDCNDEDCAPDKEVGKVSMEWLAGEKTKVSGTFPPKKKGWTGYVEKDTAGQTNIYSVEPVVYIAESAISSGTAGTSSDGAENTAGLVVFLGLISVAAASSILLQVGKNSPPVQTIEYSGPSLSYYINKFTPAEIIEASLEIPTESAPSVQLESSAAEIPEVQVETPPSDVSDVS